MARAGRPKYAEIEAELRRILAKSDPGEPLPSETDLSVKYGVSRMTARQAVKILETEGLVYRIPGSGTFASGNGAHRTMGALKSFTDEMSARGIKVTSKLIEMKLIDPTVEIRTALELNAGVQAIRIIRVRNGNGSPLAIETAHIHPRCSFVLDEDLKKESLHQLLISHGIVPTEAFGTLIATASTAADVKALKVKPGSPMLVEKRRIVDEAGSPIEFTETRYIGSKYTFDVHLRRM